MSKIEALGNYVVLKTETTKPQEIAAGLITGGQPQYVVVTVGVDVKTVKPGDVVICAYHADDVHSVNGVMYIAVRESAVKARLV